jgi:hypothetical protein
MANKSAATNSGDAVELADGIDVENIVITTRIGRPTLQRLLPQPGVVSKVRIG